MVHSELHRTIRRRHCLGRAALALCLAAAGLGPFAQASASGATSAPSPYVTSVDDSPTTDAPDPTANDFLDLERSLTECISSNPPPGCGRVPTSPGDRGGWQQLVLFGVMMGGISIIFWRVVRSVRRRDTAVRTQ